MFSTAALLDEATTISKPVSSSRVAEAQLDGLDEVGARLPLFPGPGRARDLARLDHLKHAPERDDPFPVPITRPHGLIVRCVFT
jgi:hypothetical protein